MGARLNRQWWTLQVSRFMIVRKLYKNSFDSEENFLVIFLLFFFFSKKLKFSFLVKLSVTNSLAVIANLTKKIHFFFFLSFEKWSWQTLSILNFFFFVHSGITNDGRKVFQTTCDPRNNFLPIVIKLVFFSLPKNLINSLWNCQSWAFFLNLIIFLR